MKYIRGTDLSKLFEVALCTVQEKNQFPVNVDVKIQNKYKSTEILHLKKLGLYYTTIRRRNGKSLPSSRVSHPPLWRFAFKDVFISHDPLAFSCARQTIFAGFQTMAIQSR